MQLAKSVKSVIQKKRKNNFITTQNISAMNKKITKNNLLYVIFIPLLLIFNIKYLKAQGFYPVQSSVQLLPPYSTYLTDYAQPGSEKFRVILLQKDLSQASYQLRLRFSIILDGKTIMITSRSYNPPPFTLAPGIPTVISGADLADYLDSRYLDFVGYDRSQYEKSKSLPEGSFQICVTAYDYHRQNVQVSNVGCSFYYLAKNEPPLINQPACGSRILKRDPQQTIFSWLPRNTASPNSASNTEYLFQLFERRVTTKNPNDIVQTQPPVFSYTTDLPQLIYGSAEPPLIENMQYVWRVQAIDKNGKDEFKNNGFSEVCTFTYGGENVQDLGMVKEFNAEATNQRAGKMHWKLEPITFDAYKITYKKSGSDGEWAIKESSAGEIIVSSLEPNTEYETRIQGKKNSFYGNYSDIIRFKTPQTKIVSCNLPANNNIADITKPLTDATAGMIVKAGDIDVMLLEITNTGNGTYSGHGKMYLDFLAGASFEVNLDNIFIDQNKIVGAGKIYAVTSGADYVQNSNDPLAHINKKEQQANRIKYKDVDFYENLITYEFPIENVILKEDGNVDIIEKGADGKNITHSNTNIKDIRAKNSDKALIIQDKTGNQYVIRKDGTVEKVDGGGLGAGSTTDILSLGKSLDLLKEAVQKLDSSSDSLVSLQGGVLKTTLLSQNNENQNDNFTEGNTEIYTTSRINYDSVMVQSQPGLSGYFNKLDKEETSIMEWLLNKYIASVLNKALLSTEELVNMAGKVKSNGNINLEDYKNKTLSGTAKSDVVDKIIVAMKLFLKKDFQSFIN